MESGRTPGSEARRFGGRAEVISALVLVALTGLLAITAYREVFSTFNAADDEGYLIVTLRSFAGGDALYDDVYSQYGPGFYVLMGGAMKMLGVAFTSDGAAAINLTLWLASALLAGLICLRLTGNLLIAAAGLGITFLVLLRDAFEPLHPGATVGFLVLCVAAAITFLHPRSIRWEMVLLGALVAALLTIKVNIGVFAGLSILFAMAATSGDFARLRPLRWAITAAFVLVPFGLMASHLDNRATVLYATIVSAGAVCLVVATRGADPASRPTLADAGWFVGATAVAGAVLCLATIATGTSPGGLVDGWLIEPLQHADTQFLPVPLSFGVLAWSGLGIGLVAVFSVSRRRGETLGPALGATLRIVVGIGIWIALATSSLSGSDAIAFATPVAWLITIPPAQEPAGRQFVRVALASLAILQALHAYPIAGAQLAWSIMLFAIVGAVCVADGLTAAREIAARRLPVVAVTIVVIGFAAWLGIDRLRPLHNEASERYASAASVGLSGAVHQRVDPALAAQLRDLSAAISARCDSFLTLPGLASLYLYTEQDPPEEMTSSWMLHLDSADQQAIVDGVQDNPRLCAVSSTELLNFWRSQAYPDGQIPERPLLRFIRDDFVTVDHYGGYQLAVRR